MMKDLWTNVASGLNPALLCALLALVVLAAALITGAALAVRRNRRLREQLEALRSRMDEADERTQTELAAGQQAMKSSLEDFKGDLVRVMGDMARLQKEQSGEIDRCRRGQESGAQAQADRLQKLDERLNRRLDESDRRLERLCEKSSLPAKNDGAEYLAQGLRLVTEQLKAMSAQLESLERGQVRAREVPVPPEEELVVPEEVQPEEVQPEPRDEPPRYENTSWD